MFWNIFFLIFLFSTSRAAEELAPVEVTATKELSDFHFGSAAEVTTELSPTSLLSDALANIPGVIASQNGGPGSRATYFVRGSEARHLSFTIDNLKINDPSNTDRQFDAAFMTSPFLKGITLYKGPQAVLFGPDAMGGLVDMRTRKGENAPETRLLMGAGSFGTLEATLSQDWKVNQNQGSLTWTSLRTDGISRLNEKRFGATERDASAMTQLTSSSSHRWHGRFQTEVLASFLRGSSELDGFDSDNSHDKSKSDQYLLQQRTSHELTSKTTVSLRNGLSRHQREIKTLSVGENSFEGDLVQNEILLNHESAGFMAIGGVSNEGEEFEQDADSARASLNSIFAQTMLKQGPLSLQGGLRMDEHSRFGSYRTGSAGTSVNFSPHVFAVQYSQGLKAPSLYQLYADPIFGLPIGNKDLLPEKNSALEGRWRIEKDFYEIEIVCFRSVLSNLITFTNQGFKNQSRFVAEGLEFLGALRFEAIVLRPSVTFLDFKDEDSPVLRRPRRSLGLDASWFPEETFELFAHIRAFDHRRDLDENGNMVKLNGFETVNVGVKKTSGKLEYGVQVINMLDRKYEEIYGFNVMPRSYFVSMGLRF